MKVEKTTIPGLYILEPKIFVDSRGYFYESYNKKTLIENNIECDFIQDNQSKSSYGVIRGLHYQLNPHAQTKLIRVLDGIIIDVVVDLRKGSPTYGKWYGIELSSDNRKQLLIPKGFAHGFSVLSDNAIIQYKCDAYYNPSSERGIRFDDESLKINWQIPKGDELVSERDANMPSFEEAENNFTFK